MRAIEPIPCDPADCAPPIRVPWGVFFRGVLEIPQIYWTIVVKHVIILCSVAARVTVTSNYAAEEFKVCRLLRCADGLPILVRWQTQEVFREARRLVD